jgi:hypothetical protein
MNILDTASSSAEEFEEGFLCLPEAESDFEETPPIVDRGQLDDLTTFLRTEGLCWAELGNETEACRQLLLPFEESHFYHIPKPYWNTYVPWRHQVWKDRVLIVLTPPLGPSLKEKAEQQWIRYRDITRRPLFKHTVRRLTQLAESPVCSSLADEFTLLELIRQGADLGALEVTRLKWIRELARQYLLMRRVTLGDVVFYTPQFEQEKGVQRMKCRQPLLMNSGAFFKLSPPHPRLRRQDRVGGRAGAGAD